jgi:hypothetical protein
MALERFIPKSPDIFIRNSQDFEVAKFGHLNTIVEYINNNSAKPAGLNGYVQFNNNNALGGDAGLFWDNINKRLGVGTVTPIVPLNVYNSSSGVSSIILVEQDTSATIGQINQYRKNGSVNLISGTEIGRLSFGGYFNSTYSPFSQVCSAVIGYYAGTGTDRTGGLRLTTWNGGGATTRLQVAPDGKVSIGTTGSNAKLQIVGEGSTSATTALLVQNSAGTTSLEVSDDNVVKSATSSLSFTNNSVTNAIGNLRILNQTISNAVATAITINSTSAIDLTSSLGARFLAGYLNGAFLATTSGFFVGNEVPSAISARLQVKGSGSTSATTSFLVQNSVGNNVFSIKDDENTLIGSGTNGGYKLDVNGTSNIRGSLRMGEPVVAGLIRSHPSVAMNFGGGAGDNVFTFTQINQGAFQSSSANQSLIRASINQGELGTTNYGSVFLSVGTLTNSGGTPIYNSFESRQTINCSGGTTIYRGFYHNPTLTLTTGVTHIAFQSTSGSVNINTSTIQASAVLQADSTTQGFLPPRMTTLQRNAIASPINGLIVFDTDVQNLCYRRDGVWVQATFAAV